MGSVTGTKWALRANPTIYTFKFLPFCVVSSNFYMPSSLEGFFPLNWWYYLQTKSKLEAKRMVSWSTRVCACSMAIVFCLIQFHGFGSKKIYRALQRGRWNMWTTKKEKEAEDKRKQYPQHVCYPEQVLYSTMTKCSGFIGEFFRVFSGFIYGLRSYNPKLFFSLVYVQKWWQPILAGNSRRGSSTMSLGSQT